jgi:hypothetical protein
MSRVSISGDLGEAHPSLARLARQEVQQLLVFTWEVKRCPEAIDCTEACMQWLVT